MQNLRLKLGSILALALVLADLLRFGCGVCCALVAGAFVAVAAILIYARVKNKPDSATADEKLPLLGAPSINTGVMSPPF